MELSERWDKVEYGKSDYWKRVLYSIKTDPRYLRNIEYGKPRTGHAEGTVKAHIFELENNLLRLVGSRMVYGEEMFWKLLVLIHVHDSFKAESARDVSILDPNSHSTLARNYLAQYTDDADMLAITQYHDLGYAVYRKFKAKGYVDESRMKSALDSIKDHELFLLFSIIDTCTESKGREMITWLVKYVGEHYGVTSVTEADIIPAKNPVSTW